MTSVPNFETLDRAIEAALDLSREGLVLTPPTQPEVQAVPPLALPAGPQTRRGQAGRSRGADARRRDDRRTEPGGLGPRVSPRRPRPDGGRRDQPDHRGEPAAALDLLGYDDPTELTGKRIVTIVPSATGRPTSPGSRCTSSSAASRCWTTSGGSRRCGDGSEVDVRLTVRSPPANGRSVLLAEVRCRLGRPSARRPRGRRGSGQNASRGEPVCTSSGSVTCTSSPQHPRAGGGQRPR